MGNKRNRRSRRIESQSSDREENTSETSFAQGNATLVHVFENVNNIFDRNLGSELTEPSQISNEIEVISQRLFEQNSNKMTQIEQQLNSKFEEILREIKTNRESNLANDEEDAETNRPGPSNSKNRSLRNNHASNTTLDRDKNQDDRFYLSEMSELRQPYTPLGIANETLDETIIINENRQENADHHMVTGPTKNILRQSSTNSNTTNTIGPHAATLLEHPETSDPVSQIALPIEKLARKNPEPSLYHPKNTLAFNGKLEKNEKFQYFEDLFHTTLKMQPEEMKINHFHAHLRGLALKTFEHIQRTPATTLEDILVVFRRKYVKPESSASAKHRFNRLMFQPENQKLPDFLESLQESAEKAFGEAAPQMIESLIYAKMPPHLKKSINQTYLQNGTYDQIVRHLEREMELIGLEADEPLVKTQMTAVKQQTNTQNSKSVTQNTKTKTKTPNTVPNNTLQNNQCRYCKEEGHMAKECPKLAKRQKLDNDPDAPRCSHCNTTGHEEPNCYFGANMENRPPKWTLTENQQKLNDEYKKSNKPINPRSTKPSTSKDLN